MTSFEVLGAVERGELIPFLHEQFTNDNGNELEDVISNIKNELTIEFFEQFAAPDIRNKNRNTFFKIKRLFDAILPHVSVSESVIMRATANARSTTTAVALCLPFHRGAVNSGR
jgi:hypothetical protein